MKENIVLLCRRGERRGKEGTKVGERDERDEGEKGRKVRRLRGRREKKENNGTQRKLIKYIEDKRERSGGKKGWRQGRKEIIEQKKKGGIEGRKDLEVKAREQTCERKKKGRKGMVEQRKKEGRKDVGKS